MKQPFYTSVKRVDASFLNSYSYIFKYCFDWSVSCMILSLLQDYGKPHWNQSHRPISWLLMKPNHIEHLVNSGAFFARYALYISQWFEKYKSRVWHRGAIQKKKKSPPFFQTTLFWRKRRTNQIHTTGKHVWISLCS